MISESTERIIVDEKSCQSISADIATNALHKLGYIDEEIRYFYEFSALRRLFFYNKKSRYFYFKPQSIEEWRVQLTGLLESIRNRAVELELQNEPVHEPLEQWEEDIEQLADEGAYELLSRRLKESLIRCNNKMALLINNKLNILEDKLQKSARIVGDIYKVLEDDAEHCPGRELWRHEKKRIFEQLSSLQTQYQSIIKTKAGIEKAKAADFFSSDGCEQFIVRITEIENLNKYWDKSKTLRKNLEQQVARWQSWDGFFRERERLESLVGLLSEMGLIKQAEEITQLDLDLNQNSINGLPEPGHWEERAREIYIKIQKILQQSRDQFNNIKSVMQIWLNKLGSNVHLRQQFREDQQQESINLLQEEFTQAVSQLIENWLGETEILEQRLQYLKEVLDQDIDKTQGRMDRITAELFKCQSSIKKAVTDEILKILEKISHSMPSLHKEVSEQVKPSPLDSKEAILKDVLLGKPLNLEEVILRYGEINGKLDLEEVLDLTTRLFKKNYINVKIELIS